MKCQFCGFNNQPDAKNCIKCNSPLGDAPLNPIQRANQQVSPTMAANPAKANQEQQSQVSSFPNKEFIAPTLFGEQAREPFIDRATAQKPVSNERNSEGKCPNCGYPVIEGARYCPNCNSDIFNVGKAHAQQVKIKPMPLAGTIDPYSQKGFCLRPIINGEAGKTMLEFNGDIILNRDNTIKDNMTITSKEQAEIFLQDGSWFIKDKSEKQTTFVRPGEPIRLTKGDIILLGDTKFIFE